ncbi:MAG: bifunctional isocitrate dehydrogenase kinase/phosphatase [Candidatus Protistobacter heckmanni]|nr:bifunctional isocitrate dehydrogenase kinase/phosphatase [Candidatus Protistobacter heckmanni]
MRDFPKLLSSQIAYDIARNLLDGFDKHYRIFRAANQQAKTLFEHGDWPALAALQRDRIAFYDDRVREAEILLQEEYDAENLDDSVWQQTRLHYIGLLTTHHQLELAETFFNSVYTRLLHRAYFHNDFIFVRPTIATEYIENDEPPTMPTYRAYYPVDRDGLVQTMHRVIGSFQFQREFADLDRDTAYVLRAINDELGDFRVLPNFQVHVLSSLFFRNQTAFIIGRAVNGDRTIPLAIPVKQDARGKLHLDAALLSTEQVQVLFSFTHSYFLVDMDVPSAYVTFLRTLMPRKPRAEIYTSIGLKKHGKNLFYRDLLHHLQNSSGRFRIAPGIKGLVMLVFGLPSFPYVFKVIKDYFPPPKETTRELIKRKYQLVKGNDRVGRMADTLEFSQVAFPLSRFDDELLAELRKHALSMIEFDCDGMGGEEIVIRHPYIERRMIPLNIWLRESADEKVEHGVIEYGNAIKDLVAANIFPGDMLYKNFGVMRYGRMVFYDYDEIEYLTDCNIREVPPPRNEEDELSGEPWYNMAPHDIFPETYRSFLLGDERMRKYFLMHHADFFDPAMWQAHKDKLMAGQVPDIYSYDPRLRFARRYATVPV